MANVEIIAVGNELLAGDVLDTNSHWLCRQLTGLGASVTRVVVVPDELEAIAAELRQALARKPQLVLTTGGLGPTGDDLTLAAVAQALGVSLREDPRALEMVRRRYREFAQLGYVAHGELTASRAKMARLPEGAEPLANPVGAAPGVLLRRGETAIVCLPGVPLEMTGIFTTSLSPLLRELFGAGGFYQAAIIVGIGDESALAPVLARVSEEHPAVHVKSRPKRFGEDIRIRVVASAREKTAARAEELVREALAALARALEEAGLAWEEER